MLALQQSAEQWPFSAGEGSSDRSDLPPLGYGPARDSHISINIIIYDESWGELAY